MKTSSPPIKRVSSYDGDDATRGGHTGSPTARSMARLNAGRGPGPDEDFEDENLTSTPIALFCIL